MTDPERLRIAKQFIGATAQLLHPTHEQIEQLTFALAKILHVQADDITASAKLDFVVNELALLKLGIGTALVGLASVGAKIEMPKPVAEGLGLEAKAKSSIIVPG